MTTEVNMVGRTKMRLLDHRVKYHRIQTNRITGELLTDLESILLTNLADYLKPGMTVYDIGAEEGEFGAFASMFVGDGNVHMFEPRLTIWPNIKTVWDANGLTPGGCWAGFVGTINQQTDLWGWNPEGWPDVATGEIVDFSAFPEVIFPGGTPVITLDKYSEISESVPDVIMMDVEGAEYLILQGTHNILMNHRPVIFAALHLDAFMEKYGYDRRVVFRTMREAKYNAFYLEFDHEEHWLFYPEELDVIK